MPPFEGRYCEKFRQRVTLRAKRTEKGVAVRRSSRITAQVDLRVEPRERILLTGATDGIGLALAKIFAKEGAELTLVGRRPVDQLDSQLFGPETYCQTDLRSAEAARQIRSFLQKRGWTRLDTAILNAGVGWVGPIARQEPASIHELIDVNLMAPIALAHALLPVLKGGRLVLIGSIAAAMPCPSYAVYAASKAALDGLARSLRVELQHEVDVQIVHPGATRTGMHQKAGANLPVRVPAGQPRRGQEIGWDA